MEEVSPSRLFMADLLIRGYKPEFYSLLEEEMFDNPVDKKILKAVKDGYQFSLSNMGELRKITGISLSEVAELMSLSHDTHNWLQEKDILEFVDSYSIKKIERLMKAGRIKEAVECSMKKSYSAINIIEDYKKHLQDSRAGADYGLLGISTGLSTLDRVSGGFRQAKIWVIGGYNAYGKTYFLTNMVNHMLDQGKRACILTLEMTKEDIIDRLVGEKLGLGVYDLAKTINKEVVEKEVERISEHFKNGNLILIDSLYDIEDIKTRLKVENSNRKIDVLFIDFIQLIQDKSVKGGYETVSKVSSAIQELTKELGCCTVVLSQINNEAQAEGDGATFGFKGAGEIGQIADIAIRIKRYKDTETGKFTDAYDLNVVKNRSGESGLIECKIKFPGGKIYQKEEPAVLAARAIDKSQSDSIADSFFGL